ncbi:hypothetical protein V8E36_000403 [Tilletia maclaganii]
MAAGHPDWKGFEQLSEGPAPSSSAASGSRTAASASASTSAQGGERVKRPHNAWIIYRTEKSRELRDAFLQGLLPAPPTSAHTHLLGRGTTPKREADLSKYLAALWKNEDPKIKEQYTERARKEREAHLQRHPGYRFQPRKQGRNRNASAPTSTAQSRVSTSCSEHQSSGHRVGGSGYSQTAQSSVSHDEPRFGAGESSSQLDESGRPYQQGKSMPTPSVVLSQTSQFGLAPPRSAPFHAPNVPMPTEPSMSSQIDPLSYQLASSSNQRMPWSSLSSPVDASASRQGTHSSAHDRLPPMQTYDRGGLHNPASVTGKSLATDRSIDTAVPWTTMHYPQLPPQGSRSSSTMDKATGSITSSNSSSSLLHESQSQYLPVDQGQVAHHRSVTAPQGQWQSDLNSRGSTGSMMGSGGVRYRSNTSSNHGSGMASSSSHSSYGHQLQSSSMFEDPTRPPQQQHQQQQQEYSSGLEHAQLPSQQYPQQQQQHLSSYQQQPYQQQPQQHQQQQHPGHHQHHYQPQHHLSSAQQSGQSSPQQQQYLQQQQPYFHHQQQQAHQAYPPPSEAGAAGFSAQRGPFGGVSQQQQQQPPWHAP